jgi:single-strand DNA-binding protein
MASFNKVILLGNVTRDPELKYTPKGTAVCQIGLAVNRNWTNDQGEKMEDVTFVNVELFGRTAEIANEYLGKGKPCLIEGRLKLDQWDDKQSGQKRSALKVIGETLQLLGGKRDEDGGQERRDKRGRDTENYGPPPKKPAPPADPDLDAPEDDIPF